jgi:ferritin-like metal-binding protein YciE
MKINSMKDLLINELRDLYGAEKQILKALPKMIKAATNAQLRSGFEKHLKETENQVTRLEQAFEKLGVSAKKKTCEGIKGIAEECEELISADPEAEILDAGLIEAAQKVEHYEMAGYGSVRTWARQLNLREVADLLQQTLEEEKATDKKLTELAESMVNQMAAAHT